MSNTATNTAATRTYNTQRAKSTQVVVFDMDELPLVIRITERGEENMYFTYDGGKRGCVKLEG